MKTDAIEACISAALGTLDVGLMIAYGQKPPEKTVTDDVRAQARLQLSALLEANREMAARLDAAQKLLNKWEDDVHYELVQCESDDSEPDWIRPVEGCIVELRGAIASGRSRRSRQQMQCVPQRS